MTEKDQKSGDEGEGEGDMDPTGLKREMMRYLRETQQARHFTFEQVAMQVATSSSIHYHETELSLDAEIIQTVSFHEISYSQVRYTVRAHASC